jgi:hypothetical protein
VIQKEKNLESFCTDFWPFLNFKKNATKVIASPKNATGLVRA